MSVVGDLWVPMMCRGIVLVDTTAEKGFSTGRGNLSDYTHKLRSASGWSCVHGFL